MASFLSNARASLAGGKDDGPQSGNGAKNEGKDKKQIQEAPPEHAVDNAEMNATAGAVGAVATTLASLTAFGRPDASLAATQDEESALPNGEDAVAPQRPSAAPSSGGEEVSFVVTDGLPTLEADASVARGETIQTSNENIATVVQTSAESRLRSLPHQRRQQSRRRPNQRRRPPIQTRPLMRHTLQAAVRLPRIRPTLSSSHGSRQTTQMEMRYLIN